MSKELIIDTGYVSCIDKRPTLESHQHRHDENDAAHTVYAEKVAREFETRNANEAVVQLVRMHEALQEFGPPTLPMPKYKRVFWRWVYKLKEIVKIIRE